VHCVSLDFLIHDHVRAIVVDQKALAWQTFLISSPKLITTGTHFKMPLVNVDAQEYLLKVIFAQVLYISMWTLAMDNVRSDTWM